MLIARSYRVLQTELDRIDAEFARDAFHMHIHRERALRHVEQGRQHLTRLIGVIVDRLLAEQDEAWLLLFDDGLQQLGHGQRLQLRVGFDQDAAIGANCHRGAQRLLALRHAARNCDDFGRDAFFLQTHGLLDGDLVEWIHRHLDVGNVDPASVRFHPDLDVVVDDALDGDEDLHRTRLCERGAAAGAARRATGARLSAPRACGRPRSAFATSRAITRQPASWSH